ncbi:terminase small subunit [Achromobacter aegrifaciens]
MIDLDKKTTQARFGQLVGITQPAVSGLLMRGVMVAGDTLGNWLLSYCGHIRDVAAGRQAGEETRMLDPAEEKARLYAAQADKIEMENSVARGELAPVSVLEEVLTRAGTKVSAAMDAIPTALKRRLPNLTDADLTIVRRELAKARNAVAALSLEDLEADEENEDE